jgi:peptidoglycan biosynthesis protein MviN/MurJ (putative lipid II flippase)
MISWSFSYVILSKGDTKSFLTYEVLGNITIAVTHIFGYKLWGLDGLGYAFLFSNFIYFILVYFIIKRKYLISMSYDAKRIFIYSVVCALILILIKNFTSYIIYSISIPILIFTIYMSFNKLSKKTNIGIEIINKFKFFKKK